jgi:hypothetical protein
MIFPATLFCWEIAKNTGRVISMLANILTCLGAFFLCGQYVIDLVLVPAFEGLTEEQAYVIVDNIRNHGLIGLVFYDLVGIWAIGQVLMIIALSRVPVYPKWAIILYSVALIAVLAGNSVHTIVQRSAYALITVALIPLVFAGNGNEKTKISE